MADQFNILDSQAEFADRLTSGEGNIARDLLGGSPTMTSGILRLGYRTATKTEPITQVRLWSGGTAAGATPTLVRVGIWRTNDAGDLLELMASTANDTALLATMNTEYTKALQATWQKQRGQRYAWGLLVVTAAAVPTVSGSQAGIQNNIMGYAPMMGASLGGQTDLPATSTSQTANVNRPYIIGLP